MDREHAAVMGLIIFGVAIFAGLIIINKRKVKKKRDQRDKLIKKANDLIEKKEPLSETKISHIKDPKKRVEERERALKIYTEARELVEKALKITPHSRNVKKRLFELEQKIGRLAMDSRHWSLAKKSFEHCRELGFEDEAEDLLESLETRKKALAGENPDKGK